MNLHQDDRISLEYAKAQDLLLVEVRVGILNALDVRKIFECIIAQSRKHCIPNILLDFSRNHVEMSEGDYQLLMSKLAVGLMPTCIRKVARVATTDAVREQKVNGTYAQIQKAIQLQLKFRNFQNRPNALRWLLE